MNIGWRTGRCRSVSAMTSERRDTWVERVYLSAEVALLIMAVLVLLGFLIGGLQQLA